MSATERKVVHEHLKDRDDVETYSEGTEPDRHLVVAPLSPSAAGSLGSASGSPRPVRAFHVKRPPRRPDSAAPPCAARHVHAPPRPTARARVSRETPPA